MLFWYIVVVVEFEILIFGFDWFADSNLLNPTHTLVVSFMSCFEFNFFTPRECYFVPITVMLLGFLIAIDNLIFFGFLKCRLFNC